MQKVVINRQYGGYSLTDEHMAEYNKRRGSEGLAYWDVERDDPILVAIVEEGEIKGSSLCTLRVVSIPDGVEWEIHQHDGKEWVAEKHETWS